MSAKISACDCFTCIDVFRIWLHHLEQDLAFSLPDSYEWILSVVHCFSFTLSNTLVSISLGMEEKRMLSATPEILLLGYDL